MKERPGRKQSEVYLVCTQYLLVPLYSAQIIFEIKTSVCSPTAIARLRTDPGGSVKTKHTTALVSVSTGRDTFIINPAEREPPHPHRKTDQMLS